MQQIEPRDIVATGSHPGFDFVSVRHGAEVVHRVTVTGPLDLRRRILMYEETLKANTSARYFCILDNSAEHENVFGYNDIQMLAEWLSKEGLTAFYGVTITNDAGYPKLVQIVTAVLQILELGGTVTTTSDPEVAEAFIREKLDLVAALGTQSSRKLD
ncbi:MULTISPECIES: hypothetical protein [unclassified Minwuia]|jgi:hypothetical protein|uniref:hypothetical protein n=1 Tax=unclassified Minwuia TaxID=2618799 RepID=UPI0024796BF8|nr:MULTISPECIES: hypothetical protein [unclassified Minwuia]